MHAAVDRLPREDVLLGLKFQSDRSFGFDFDGFAPELQFGADSAMKYEVLGLSVPRTDRRMMTHLFKYDFNP